VLTGPAESAEYFEQVDAFIGLTLGKSAQDKYQIIINDPEKVAQVMASGLKQVRSYRKDHKDAYYFNWLLKIQKEFQQPFVPNHENMSALQLHRDQPKHMLAADLRRAFSGIVAGNVKPDTIRSVRQLGPFEINGEKEIMSALDNEITGYDLFSLLPDCLLKRLVFSLQVFLSVGCVRKFNGVPILGP